MSSWIKLHRSMMDHWLYKEHRPMTRREAWETMLLLVNYEPSKTMIHSTLYECDRGQSLLSIGSWADKFLWSIKQVRTFFKLLEKDGMIAVEGLRHTTRLTICNYGLYQDKGRTEVTTEVTTGGVTDGEQREQQRATIKEGKELKEREEIKEKESLSPAIASTPSTPKPPKFDFKAELIKIGVSEQVASEYMAVRKTKRATNTKTAFDDIEAQITKTGKTAQECIAFAVKKSWAGFESSWMDNATTHLNNAQQKQPSMAESWGLKK